MKQSAVLLLFLAVLCYGVVFQNDQIYKRNGDVYILVGDGINKGVYGPFRETGETIIVSNGSNPTAKRLFSPGQSGKAIAVDMFSNVYLLCAEKTDFGAPRVTPQERAQLVADQYPRMGDIDARNFYRVVMGDNGQWIYCSSAENWNNHFGHGFNARNWRSWLSSSEWSKAYRYGNGFWKDRLGNLLIPDGQGFDTNCFSRLPNGYTTKMHTSSHGGRGQYARITNYRERDLTFWDDYYNEKYRKISIAGSWDPYANQFNAFEKVFHLFQCNYAYKAEGASCNDSPPGENYSAQPITTPTGKMDICVAVSGRRYFYSSVPDEILKIGKMQTQEVDANGISYMKPVAMSETDAEQVNLPDGTNSIGAATKTRTEDWFYHSEAEQMDVCDQWDSLGGIKYEVLSGNRRFRRTEMNGLAAGDSVNFNVPGNVPGEIKTIAGDGNGNCYYGVIAQELKPDGWNPNTAWPPDSIKDLEAWVFVPDPNDPNPPPASAFQITHKWTSVFTDGWFFRVYRVKENNINDHYLMFKILLGGNVYIRSDFGFYQGTNLVRLPEFSSVASLDLSAGIDVSKIDVDLAVVNIGGPPIAGDDLNHIDFVMTDTNGIPIPPKDPAKPNDDFIQEDEWVEYWVENPPSFGGDKLNKNNNYGLSTLKRTQPLNSNGFTGGYTVALIEGSDAQPGLLYYVRVIDVLANNRVLYEYWMPNAVNANNITGEGVAPAVTPVNGGVPAHVLTPLAAEKLSFQAVNLSDNFVYLAGGQPQIERKGFRMLFKDRGVYKIQMMAVYKRYNYEEMPFPSFIEERASVGYAMAVSPAAPFTWRDPRCKLSLTINPNTPPAAWNSPYNMNFIAERVVHVGYDEGPSPGFISHIQIKTNENTQRYDEDSAVSAYGVFYVQWAKYFRQGLGADNIQSKVDAFDGVGVWNYPADGIFPNNAKNGAGDVNNLAACLNGPAGTACTGNWKGTADINSDSKSTLEDYPYNGVNVPITNNNGSNKGVYGTYLEDAGAGGSNLSDKDWREIKYRWFVGAFIYQNIGGVPQYVWTQVKLREGDLSENQFIFFRQNVDILDEPSPWDSFNPTDFAERRIFKVKMKLTADDSFKFVMPLSPSPGGDQMSAYYMWLDFSYPTLRWEGRDELPDQANVYNYYDAVYDTIRQSSYRDIIAENPGPKTDGYQFWINDTEGPALYYHVTDDYADGGTTADMFPRDIQYIVVDNNPNNPLNPANFKLSIQQENPSATSGNGSFSNTQDRLAAGVYRQYDSQLDTSFAVPEGSEADLAKDGSIDDDFAAIVLGQDTSSYYHISHPGFGPGTGLIASIHRYACLYNQKNTVGPLPENYNSNLYWYAFGSDSNGNMMNMNGGSGAIPPENAGTEAAAPWKYAGKLMVKDNDPPEISFTVTIPKLNRVIKYQISDDDRDDIFDDPMYGFNDEGMTGMLIDNAVLPGATALCDNTEWDSAAGILYALDNASGTERGKMRISVTGDGISEPRLIDAAGGADKPKVIYDSFVSQGQYFLDPADKPVAASLYCQGEYFDFGKYMQDSTPAQPYILGIDEDMRVAMEVKSRDNVDHITNNRFDSHNLIEQHGGGYPVTFAGNVSIDVSYTQDIDWSGAPAENITMVTDSTGHKHAVFFYQFRESTVFDPAAAIDEVEYIRVRVADTAGNVRAFRIPLRILDTRMIDELLKRQKERIDYKDF